MKKKLYHFIPQSDNHHNDAEAYYLKGEDYYYKYSKGKEAIECFNQAININPYYIEAYTEKGSALRFLGDYIQALECLEQAIELDPNYVIAYYQKVRVLCRLAKKQEAIECFNIAEKLICNNAESWKVKADALYFLGRYEEAIEAYDLAIKLKPNNALYYCTKGKTLNKLGKEQEALECFNKAFEISKTGKLGNNLSKGNISYINKTLSQDREELLQKLTKLQATTIETQKMVDSLDQKNPEVKKVVKRLDGLRKSKSISTEEIFDSFEKQIKEDNGDHKTNEALLKQLTDMQAQMEALQKEVKIIKDQQIQTDNRLIGLETFKQLTITMQSKLEANKAINDQNKAVMQKQINDIAKKMQNCANNDDVKLIIEQMVKLIKENRFTKGKLIDLEADVDKIVTRQDCTDERLEKLEIFKQTVEKIITTLNDRDINTGDKVVMQKQLNDITKKMQTLANKSEVERITVAMKNMLSENKITKITLLYLESNIDKIIETQTNSASSTKECADNFNNLEAYELALGGLISLENYEAPAG